ncbi:DNA primase small subunit domain-containing protein [Thermogladius sp. KZ2Tp1]|uniref:DNA primase small subunit domain-containing protein n=1 Tax=Thermogladius sp. KZ2Tp1 TaxID=3136289 RepID=UPI003DA87D83
MLRQYYSRRPLVEPPNLHSREIALVDLESETYVRHLSFPSMAQLYHFILDQKTPLHLYYSSAVYEDPSAENMSMKGWKGSELIFDIDVDHLPGCELKLKVCVEDNSVLGEHAEKCPSGSEPVEVSVIEPECFRKGLSEASKLREILEDDFGFRDVKVYFSGHRGFHVRVSDDLALDLTREARASIADYVSCENMDVSRLFPSDTSSRAGFVYFGESEVGFRKRVLKLALEMGLAEKVVAAEGFRSPPRHSERGVLYRLPGEYLSNLLSDLCVKVDKVVTMDITRLSRFEGGINGKAGLKVAEFKEAEPFSFTDLFAWSGRVVVSPLIDFAGFRVFDQKLNLKRGVRLEMEAPYAIYLILKKLANYVGDRGVEPLV